jgi:hypothetical protein
LLRRLKQYGVIPLAHRGKGSEEILGYPDRPGPTMPIKSHGKGTEHSPNVIKYVLNCFNIDPDKFWNE